MMRSVPAAVREEQETYEWWSFVNDDGVGEGNCIEIKFKAGTEDSAFYREAIVGRLEEVYSLLKSQGLSEKQARRAIFDVMFATYMADEFTFLSQQEIERRAELEAADG